MSCVERKLPLLMGLVGVSGFLAEVVDAIAVETDGEVWLCFECVV